MMINSDSFSGTLSQDFDDKRDKYGRIATALNDERVRDDRFMDSPRPQDDGRQNMNAPAGGDSGGGGGGNDGGGDSGSGDSKFGNTYGLRIQFLKHLGINEPINTRVFVANLDYTVDEKKLLEVFRLAGKVLHVELAKDKDGKSRGFGTVEYDHPVESVQAISMLHNQQLYDRRMIVRLDRAIKPDTPLKLPEGLKGIGMGLGAGGSRLVNVARNISNIEANNPPVVNPFSALVSATGPVEAGLNNVVPVQLGVGGLSNLQASLASGQGYNSFARRGLSKMDNDVGFGGNNTFGGFNSSGRDFDGRFNRGDNDRIPGAGGGFVGNQGQRGGGNRQNTYGSRSVSDTILIRNLPPNITWEILVDKFENIREVKFDEMRETDTVMVRFASERDAERAVSIMNRMRISDRKIDVCFY
ncbi:myelin expression factor 2-like isoform X2 [Bombus fervidus]|uniref:myelin expression factor 2-like isoform X2 n=1 Tax=Bombus fervidus TaxID=203811 RepID=UPI003AB7FCA7